jgi:hypothetical protein
MGVMTGLHSIYGRQMLATGDGVTRVSDVRQAGCDHRQTAGQTTTRPKHGERFVSAEERMTGEERAARLAELHAFVNGHDAYLCGPAYTEIGRLLLADFLEADR